MRFSSFLACFLLSFLIGVAINGQLFHQDMGPNSQNSEVVGDGSDPGLWTQPEYETNGTNGTVRTISFILELCLGRHAKVSHMGHDVGDEFSVSLVPISSTVSSKLLWRHHVDSPAIETLTARAMNLGDQGLFARLQLIIHRPHGCTAWLGSQSFGLIPGVRTRLSFDYEPRGGPGRYCFVASLIYGVDANGNGGLDGYEPLGAASRHDGCFSYR